MPVEDVGMGVGYFNLSLGWWEEGLSGERSEGEARATRFAGRGRGGGDELYGSNAGSSEGPGAGRLTPATVAVLEAILGFASSILLSGPPRSGWDVWASN